MIADKIKKIKTEDGYELYFKNCVKLKKIREEFDKNALNLGKFGWGVVDQYKSQENFEILEVTPARDYTQGMIHKYYFLNEQMIARRRCHQSEYFLVLKDFVPIELLNSGFYLPTEQEVEKKYEEAMRKEGFPRQNDPRYREIYY